MSKDWETEERIALFRPGKREGETSQALDGDLNIPEMPIPPTTLVDMSMIPQTSQEKNN